LILVYIKLTTIELQIGEDGFTSFRDKRFHPSLKLTKRIYPHLHNMDGFYVAKFKKYADGEKEVSKIDKKVKTLVAKKKIKTKIANKNKVDNEINKENVTLSDDNDKEEKKVVENGDDNNVNNSIKKEKSTRKSNKKSNRDKKLKSKPKDEVPEQLLKHKRKKI
jgi:ribosomal RNA methyltransferase Nop2